MNIQGVQSNISTPITKVSNKILIKNETVAFQDSQNLSSTAMMKYEFRQKFQSTITDLNYNASFITSFAKEYNQLKNEITNNYTNETQKTMLTLLDEVFDESVKEIAERVAQSFEFFFDGSANLEARYKMGNKESIFNHESFKDHLISMANVAKDIVSQTGNSDLLEQELSTKFQGMSLESMGYEDVKNLSQAIQQISMPSLQGDSYHFGGRLAKWNDSAKEILHNANLSENVLKQALHSVEESTNTYKRVGSYIQAFNNTRNLLEDQLKEMMKIHLELESIAEKMQELEKQKKENMKLYLAMMSQFLERDGSLRELSKGIGENIKSLQKEQEYLVNNPSSAFDSNEFKEIEKGFNDFKNSKKNSEVEE